MVPPPHSYRNSVDIRDVRGLPSQKQAASSRTTVVVAAAAVVGLAVIGKLAVSWWARGKKAPRHTSTARVHHESANVMVAFSITNMCFGCFLRDECRHSLKTVTLQRV